ncbi:MAG TPA: cytochrome b N-terminal domain-containing protein [Acidobacteriota bacterium]|nr:cytochrome b N-terminal domain-containing protein [Acidobacteriota bacterium]
MKFGIKEFLYKPIPDRVGWPHVFGSMLLTLLVLQFLTGILLSFVYSASPESAWKSVRYISEEMPGGAWLRGIHFWGASLMVIVLGLHLIRTFLFAAYRKPRAFTWIVGVLLLLVILGFAQTGYLLPWDQKAYWGTNVTIEIVRTTPFLGNFIADLLRGGGSVSGLTLSRFYTIHILLLPLAAISLVALHLLFIQRHGITVPWSKEGELAFKTKPFHPEQTAKDAAGMLFITALTLLMAYLIPPHFGNPADPTDNTFVPRPDWYFLFLFQLLTYFEGRWEIIGTFLIPTLGIVLLLALPFIDRNTERKLISRPLAIAAILIAIFLWSFLTYAAVEKTPKTPKWYPVRGMELSRAERIKRPSEVGGMHVLKEYCFSCHSLTAIGPKPSLQLLSRKQFPAGEAWLEQHLTKHGADADLNRKETDQILSTLRVASGDHPELLYSIPPNVRIGARLFYSQSCTYCHKIDGQGGEQSEVKAPDLTFRLLRPKQWHMQHIKDPRTLVPKSEMPPSLHGEPWEYSALADYILYLHKP